MRHFTLLFWVICFCPSSLKSQTVFQPLADSELYLFLDELANDQLIDLYTVAKPYSRSMIYAKLIEALDNETILSRQKERIEILLDDFGFDGNLSDTLNHFSQHFTPKRPFQIIPPRVFSKSEWGKILMRPIYGIRLFNNGNRSFFASYGGAEMGAYLGKGFAIYANIRDNYQQEYRLARPDYLTRELGGNYKSSVIGKDGGEFSELRAGITYSWDWGSVGLVKDHIEWGNNYQNANILSGRTPSFPMVTLDLKPFKWLQFKYFHGWLNSEVIDSSRSYFPHQSERYRKVLRTKYIAANLFTISPWKALGFSFGNSIIYSDTPPNPAYLIPFSFFKSLDHTIDDNQNSQLFFDISFRGIKHLHLFSSLFLDELSFTRIFDPDRRNFYSYKIGAGLSNWPIPNLGFNVDYNLTSPITYAHRVPTLTYESNDFNLGHFMGDNTSSLFFATWWKFSPRWTVNVLFEKLQKGTQHIYDLNAPIPVDEKSFLENIIWEAKIIEISLEWSPVSNLSVFSHCRYKKVNAEDEATRLLYESQSEIGNNLIIFAGLKYGFQ